MTKAKMPVAKRHTSRAITARTGQVWTEELTYLQASANSAAPFGIDCCAPLGGLSFGGRS